MSVNIIHIFGASGSGTTTLAQNLENKCGYKWLDTDNFFWLPTEPPFTTSRPPEERVRLLSESINENPKCVISGSLCGWGDVFIPQFELVIFIYTPSEIRKERLMKREFQRYGNRIYEDGDMYEEHIKFIDWAMAYDTGDINMRSLINHEEWLKKITYPVVKLNGADNFELQFDKLKEYIL
jgi:adenylate kinase family enzyme